MKRVWGLVFVVFGVNFIGGRRVTYYLCLIIYSLLLIVCIMIYLNDSECIDA